MSWTRSKLLSLFKSYLSDRSQYVQKYASSNIICGVPQGSIHGHRLFILYINDFNSCTKDLNFMHFADDSTLHTKGKSLSDLAAKIITELHKVVKWLNIKRLSINISKSFFTVFSNVSQANLPSLSINRFSLVHYPTTKHLGIWVDNNLNFDPHIRDVCSKVTEVFESAKNLP